MAWRRTIAEGRCQAFMLRMEIEAAEARAAVLLKRAERYRGLAAKAAERETGLRLLRQARAFESEAAIEMAHAALLRHSARASVEAREEAIVGGEDAG